MNSLKTYLLALLSCALFACALEHPGQSAGPCGSAGQRCCPADERADAGAGDFGCQADHICVANTSMDGGVLSRTVCQRCATGQIVCNNRCVDPASDNANCGGCGMVCNAPNRCQAPPTTSGGRDAGVSADAGARILGVCACTVSGQIFCATNDAGAGACVNPLTDNANCGRCGNRCPSGQPCMNGSCACSAGQMFCAAAGDGELLDDLLSLTRHAQLGQLATARDALRWVAIRDFVPSTTDRPVRQSHCRRTLPAIRYFSRRAGRILPDDAIRYAENHRAGQYLALNAAHVYPEKGGHSLVRPFCCALARTATAWFRRLF